MTTHKVERSQAFQNEFNDTVSSQEIELKEIRKLERKNFNTGGDQLTDRA